MRSLPRRLFAAIAAFGLAIGMMASAAAACPDGTMRTVTSAPAHDCDPPASDAPTTADHEQCRMLASCVRIGVGQVSVMLASAERAAQVLPSARDDAPPATLTRAPAPPPPRA